LLYVVRYSKQVKINNLFLFNHELLGATSNCVAIKKNKIGEKQKSIKADDLRDQILLCSTIYSALPSRFHTKLACGRRKGEVLMKAVENIGSIISCAQKRLKDQQVGNAASRESLEGTSITDENAKFTVRKGKRVKLMKHEHKVLIAKKIKKLHQKVGASRDFELIDVTDELMGVVINLVTKLPPTTLIVGLCG
jgi:hypothetical protein